MRERALSAQGGATSIPLEFRSGSQHDTRSQTISVSLFSLHRGLRELIYLPAERHSSGYLQGRPDRPAAVHEKRHGIPAGSRSMRRSGPLIDLASTVLLYLPIHFICCKDRVRLALVDASQSSISSVRFVVAGKPISRRDLDLQGICEFILALHTKV